MAPVVVPRLLLRFFVEDLLADCTTGVCRAGLRLEVKPMKRFEEADDKAWLLARCCWISRKDQLFPLKYQSCYEGMGG